MTINLYRNQSSGALNPSVIRLQNHKGFQKAPMRNFQKETMDSIVAVFADHQVAKAVTEKLAEDGFATSQLKVIGKGYHSEDKAVGIYDSGDRISQPIGLSVNKAHKFERNDKAQQASIVNFHGDISRRIGNIRAVTLKNRTVNTDHIFGAQKFDEDEVEEKR